MATIADRTSRLVRYTSTWGCPAIADAANPQGGPDASAALQALADLGRSAALEIVVDQPLLVNSIALATGTTIRGLGPGSYPGAATPATGLWMKANPSASPGGTAVCVLRNAHWSSNFDAASPASSSLDVSRVVDQDITIRDLFVDGQKRNGASGYNAYSDPRTNASNQYMCCIAIFGCYNLLVENVCVYDPASFHVAVANIGWASFRGLRFCDPGYYSGTWSDPSPNTDGLHMVGPWRDVEVDGLSGTTGDDFLALNAAEGNLGADAYAPGNAAFGPHVWGGWGNVYYGNGVRLTARGLHLINCADVFRVQTGYDATNSNPANYVDHLLIEGVAGSVVQGAMQSNAFAGQGQGGWKYRVTLRDWDLDLLDPSGSNAPIGYQFCDNWGDVSIVGHRYRNVPGGSGAIGHQVNLGPGATIGRLALDGYSIRDDSGGASSVLPAISVAQGSIDELIVRDSGWHRGAATAVPFLSISGGTVGRVALAGVSGDNLANLLSITGGAVGQADTSGIVHRNPDTSGAAGGAAIDVGAGVTLPSLTASGSDTARLLGTSAGTVTTSKTDGTERGS